MKDAAFFDEKENHEAATTPRDDGLHLDSRQLLAETEELLASYDTPTDTQQDLDVNSASMNTKSSEEDKTENLQNDNISAGKRREIWNAQAAQPWRAVAARQLERRMQAEQQQKLLRAEVVGRTRLIPQMSLLLEDRLKSKQQDRLISYEWVETNCETGGSALFTTMLEELDDAYLRTDDFVHGLEFESAVQVAYTLTRNQKDGVLYFDSADRVVVPYNFE
ncbi:hypothetical protein GQ600_24035 [Phytophthora cactorum]|nr:hypothetical protein GQ600_24035 [Phytophthora cactorum]